MPEPYVYPVDDRPDAAEVLVDGQWFAAELRMRTERADGYHYNASWHCDGHTYPCTFLANKVRVDTTDRSQGDGRP